MAYFTPVAVNEDKRIYVVIAEAAIIHDCYYGDRTVIHPAGRLAAQCAHVVSKARVHEFMSKKAAPLTFEPITTIVLSGRNNKELNLLGGLLTEADVPMEWFFDTNPEAYYGKQSVLTAICTHPIDPKSIEEILGHLTLWSPKCG